MLIVLQPNSFVMESHIPYFALRSSRDPCKDKRPLRRHGTFIPIRPCPENGVSGDPEYLYEAQISILVTGVDEWVWTAYCFTDTFFGSEDTIHDYDVKKADAPTGGETLRKYPVWNPREYFIRILFRRMRQATKEWGNIVSTLEARLGAYVSFP